ncbi:MAG: cation-transporting P-type ATPase, partial [Tatlockia sp.]|nr:cation-transporting P-type ATPase [Tatlockia sp.]
MSKTIIFQHSFFLTGIMCFEGCGSIIRLLLEDSFEEFKQQNLLPTDARLIIDPKPHGFGIHRLKLMIETERNDFVLAEAAHDSISTEFKQNLVRPDQYSGEPSTFALVNQEEDTEKEASNKKNWINILINVSAMVLIVVLSVVFPPSIPLTIILTAISFLSTAFTAREYLLSFYRNLRNKNIANMTTTITLGWVLSLAHTLFHVIAMPLAVSFSMVFMSFIMPVMLITFINGMDEIKRLILNKSNKMNLEGLKSLFPQMSKSYTCYQLDKEASTAMTQWMNTLITPKNADSETIEERLNRTKVTKESIKALLSKTELGEERKNLLQEGMIIQIKRGECFP